MIYTWTLSELKKNPLSWPEYGSYYSQGYEYKDSKGEKFYLEDVNGYGSENQDTLFFSVYKINNPHPIVGNSGKPMTFVNSDALGEKLGTVLALRIKNVYFLSPIIDKGSLKDGSSVAAVIDFFGPEIDWYNEKTEIIKKHELDVVKNWKKIRDEKQK